MSTSKSKNAAGQWGSEITLMAQLIMLARKMGADEHFWKILSSNKVALSTMLDTLTRDFGERYECNYPSSHIGLFCFSQTSEVAHTEVVERVSRLGGEWPDAGIFHDFTARLNNQFMNNRNCAEFELPNIVNGIVSFGSSKLDGSGRAFCVGYNADTLWVQSGPVKEFQCRNGFWKAGTLFAVLIKH